MSVTTENVANLVASFPENDEIDTVAARIDKFV